MQSDLLSDLGQDIAFDFAKMVEARLIVAAHDALGLKLDETEPQDDQIGA
ncbi:hypothetical protein [Sphingomonas montanisoli]|nr:hypothetical protein [Sphingomonas montanisoli]